VRLYSGVFEMHHVAFTPAVSATDHVYEFSRGHVRNRTDNPNAALVGCKFKFVGIKHFSRQEATAPTLPGPLQLSKAKIAKALIYSPK